MGDFYLGHIEDGDIVEFEGLLQQPTMTLPNTVRITKSIIHDRILTNTCLLQELIRIVLHGEFGSLALLLEGIELLLKLLFKHKYHLFSFNFIEVS